MTVGGDKDDYGCYIGAGYTWSQTHKACLRSWEET
jgi:hypothetical protein